MTAFLRTLATEYQGLLAAGFGRAGGLRSPLLNSAVVLVFGGLLPWYKGLDFLDPMIVLAYTAMALLFAAPATAALLGDSERTGSAAVLYARVGAAVLYGWGVAVLILALGIGTVNLTVRHPGLLHPSWGVLGGTLLFGLAASLLVGLVCALLTLLFSAGAAMTVLRLLFLLALLLLVFGWRWLPETWSYTMARQMTSRGITRLALIGSGIVLALDAALLVVLRAPFLDRRDG